jgi:thiol-disulfide isomerase/thioredoxin
LPIGELLELGGATAWLNSEPLTPAGLRGKVVVVQFCTISCVNWLRTLPYVRAWAEKYRDDGLVVIGAHSPEFAFEHDLEKIRSALEGMGVDYPVAVDNDFAVWRAFDNAYRPARPLLRRRRGPALSWENAGEERFGARGGGVLVAGGGALAWRDCAGRSGALGCLVAGRSTDGR